MEWIRRMADFSKTRVIFTTNDDPTQYVDRAIKAGAASLLKKGSDLSQLLSIVHRFLGQPVAAA
jgi:DNA-binding NarL/FixJ family response regulator